MATGTLAARLVLLFAVVIGAVTLVSLAIRRPDFLGLNADVYRVAARTTLDGGDLYAAHPPGDPVYRFRYPPAVVLVFLPLAVLSRLGALAVVDVVSVVAGLALARLIAARLRTLGVALSSADVALIAAFVVGSVHAVPTLYYGNVNLLLAAATGAGLLWVEDAVVPSTDSPAERGSDETVTGTSRRGPDPGRLAGVVLAVPAVVKAFPAVFAAWTLRRRAWRAAATAIAVGLVADVVSFAVFDVETHLTYLERALLARLSVGTPYPPSAQYVTLRRPLSVLGVRPPLRGAVAAALVAPVVAYANTRVRTPIDGLVGLYALVAGTLVALPSYFLYLVFLVYPLVPLCYLLEGPSRLLFLPGVTTLSLPVTLDTAARLTAVSLGVGVDTLGPLETLLTVGTPPLWGVCLTLAACVLQRWERPP